MLTAAVASRGERRRASTLRDIAVGLAAIELSVRSRVPTLGNQAAKIALQALREELDHQLARMDTLADEFRELAESESEQAESSE